MSPGTGNGCFKSCRACTLVCYPSPPFSLPHSLSPSLCLTPSPYLAPSLPAHPIPPPFPSPQVLFHRMALRVSSFLPLSFDMSQSQSRLRIATTAAPVSAADLEREWREGVQDSTTHHRTHTHAHMQLQHRDITVHRQQQHSQHGGTHRGLSGALHALLHGHSPAPDERGRGGEEEERRKSTSLHGERRRYGEGEKQGDEHDVTAAGALGDEEAGKEADTEGGTHHRHETGGIFAVLTRGVTGRPSLSGSMHGGGGGRGGSGSLHGGKGSTPSLPPRSPSSTSLHGTSFFSRGAQFLLPSHAHPHPHHPSSSSSSSSHAKDSGWLRGHGGGSGRSLHGATALSFKLTVPMGGDYGEKVQPEAVEGGRMEGEREGEGDGETGRLLEGGGQRGSLPVKLRGSVSQPDLADDEAVGGIVGRADVTPGSSQRGGMAGAAVLRMRKAGEREGDGGRERGGVGQSGSVEGSTLVAAEKGEGGGITVAATAADQEAAMHADRETIHPTVKGDGGLVGKREASEEGAGKAMNRPLAAVMEEQGGGGMGSQPSSVPGSPSRKGVERGDEGASASARMAVAGDVHYSTAATAAAAAAALSAGSGGEHVLAGSGAGASSVPVGGGVMRGEANDKEGNRSRRDERQVKGGGQLLQLLKQGDNGQGN